MLCWRWVIFSILSSYELHDLALATIRPSADDKEKLGGATGFLVTFGLLHQPAYHYRIAARAVGGANCNFFYIYDLSHFLYPLVAKGLSLGLVFILGTSSSADQLNLSLVDREAHTKVQLVSGTGRDYI